MSVSEEEKRRRAKEHAIATTAMMGSIVLGCDDFVLDRDSELRYAKQKSLNKEYGRLVGYLMKHFTK